MYYYYVYIYGLSLLLSFNIMYIYIDGETVASGDMDVGDSMAESKSN